MAKNYKRIKDIVIITKIRPIQNDVYAKSISDNDCEKMHAWDDLVKQKSGVENRDNGITGSIFGNEVNIYCSGCEIAKANFKTGSIFDINYNF